MRAFLAGVLMLGFLAPSRADELPVTKDVDLVVCLDVSGSMNGLIDSAKIRLWDIVNELAKMKPTPNLRVSLYSYGHSSYPANKGWVRKEIDLTTDLDEVYAKLNALRIGGGNEYVGRVSKTALTEQKWCDRATAMRLMFVCGNESAHQDGQVKLDDVAKLSKELGVIVNTIYCGSEKDSDSEGYAAFAAKCGGKYANIDQNRSRKVPHIATPYDKEILTFNEKLNGTYVAIANEAGKKGAENQLKQDKNAAANAPAAELGRAAAKAGSAYKNSSWDLVDKMKEDPKFDLAKLKDEELPEELKKLKPEERVEYIKKKGEERCDLQKKIGELSAKRQKHIDEELKKQPKEAGEKALDEALKTIIRDQAKAKGFTTEEKK